MTHFRGAAEWRRADRRTPVAREGFVTEQAEYPHYSMIFEWEPEGGVYVVTFPELPGCRTHGRTLAEAVAQARDALESWVDIAREDGNPLPAPRYFDLRPGHGPARDESAGTP